MTSAEVEARIAALGIEEEVEAAAASLPPLTEAQRARLRAVWERSVPATAPPLRRSA